MITIKEVFVVKKPSDTGSVLTDKSSLPRRAFLKVAGLGVPIMALLGKIPQALAGPWERGIKNYWHQGRFAQDNVNTGKIHEGIIEARINDRWDKYRVAELNDAFMEWNLKARLDYLKKIAQSEMPSLSGPHCASVATYGGRRRDSEFTLNNAVKGMGLVPKKDRIEELGERLKSTMDADMKEKLEILQDNYNHPELWDRGKQISLELYARPEFETHTFLNLMANPMATIIFLDMPSYELRTIVRIIHPQDPNMLPEEKALLEYSNLAHGYFHGGAERLHNLLVFHIIEQFDNSPGSGMGVRVQPPLPEE